MRTLALIILIVLIAAPIQAGASKPAREVFGLRLGMSENAVHKRLRKIATQQKEEREEEEGGEQEVWIFKNNPRYRYVLTRFSHDHRLILITVMAQSNQVTYADIGDLKTATVASDGMNYSYKWKLPAQGKQSALLVVARGSNADFLTSFSIYASR